MPEQMRSQRESERLLKLLRLLKTEGASVFTSFHPKNAKQEREREMKNGHTVHRRQQTTGNDLVVVMVVVEKDGHDFEEEEEEEEKLKEMMRYGRGTQSATAPPSLPPLL